MSMTRCLQCGARMERKKKEMKFKVSPTITVQKVEIEHCPKCNFESVSEKEAIRVQKLVNEIKRGIGKTKVRRVILI